MPAVKQLDLPPDKKSDLVRMLLEKFQLVLRARSTQVDDKALRWQKNYDAIPAQEVRTVPFVRAANFMPGLIRMHSDILGARILGIIFGTHPFWKVSTVLNGVLPAETLQALADGMNYLWDAELHGFEFVDQIVNHSLQTGNLTLKGLWLDEVKTYLNGDAFVDMTSRKIEYEPVPFEDFWPYPITAKNTRKAEILFHRVRFTARDVKDRVDDKRWTKLAGDLMFPAQEGDTLQQARGDATGISLTPDVDYPYSAIECWLDYKVEGKNVPIVVTMNPNVGNENAILRAYYNFMPYGERPFIDFVPMPRKGSFYGYSVPEVLEQDQEELAQIHNQRRDNSTIVNVPGWKKKRYADVPNPATDWYPGCVWEVDEMDDIEPLTIQTSYQAMLEEEQFGLSLAERKVGISPSMQGFGAGQSAGKRGVYTTGGTLALLSEGNRRLDIFIRRLRFPFHRLGRLTAQAYNAFAPGHWDRFGETGARIRDAFRMTDQQGGLLYDLSATDANANREVDRQNLIQMSTVMATYYQQVLSLAGIVKQLPEGDPLRPIALLVLDGARDLANRILFAFDQPDRGKLVPDLTKILTGGAPEPAAAVAGNGSGEMRGAQVPVSAPQLQNFLRDTAALSSGAQ